VGGADVRVCKVSHIKDFFHDVKEYPNPLSEAVIS
jgi:6-phosphofructokinase 1